MNRTLKNYLLVAMLVLPLTGCGTLPGGALAGKTKLHQEYTDITGPTTRADGSIESPAQTITYVNKSVIAAGNDIADAASAHVEATPDGWRIDISGDRQADTTAQADALVQSTAQSMAAMAEILRMLTPVLSQAVNAKVEQGRIEAGLAAGALDKLPDLTLRGATP